MRHPLRRSRAKALLIQQSVRRVPAMPGIRQHDRPRPGPGDSRQEQIAQPGRDRTVDQAALSVYLNDFKKSARSRGIPAGHPDPRTDIRTSRPSSCNAVREFFDYLETKKYKLHVRVFLSRYRGYTVCPDCQGSRLRQEARDIYHRGQEHRRCLPHDDSARVTNSSRTETDAQPGGDRGTHSLGDPVPAAIPERRRPAVPDAGTALLDAVGRRSAANPAGDVARILAGRRLVCSRRALDRTTSARRTAPDRDSAAAARHRKHGARCRTRRGNHARRRPHSRSRTGRW